MESKLKQADYTYEQIRLMRESLISEIRGEFPGSIGLEVLKLVEMRLNNIILAGLNDTGISKEINRVKTKKLKVHI